MADPRQDREHKMKTQQERAGTDRDERGGATSPTDVERQRPLPARRTDSLTLSPFDMFRRMSQEMDRMFNSTLRPFNEAGWSPQVEMFERDNKLVVRADLPGLSKDDVKVELRDNVLTIEGERRDEREENREGFYHSERSYGSFFRSVPLPEGATGENCNASFNNGVLEITMDAPKSGKERARRIDISQGGPTTGSKR